MGGSFLFNRTVDDNGTSALGVIWTHRQNFSLTSKLNLDVNYTSNTSIDRRNSTNPSTVIQQVTSRANYDKRFAWGTLSVGANRSQSLTNGSITEAIPAVSFSPEKPLGAHLLQPMQIKGGKWVNAGDVIDTWKF